MFFKNLEEGFWYREIQFFGFFYCFNWNTWLFFNK